MSAVVQVHKAVEPDNLSVKGKKRYAALVQSVIAGDGEAIVEPKYDGVYTQVRFTDKDGWRAFSRTGQAMPSVSDEVLDVFYTKGLPERAYNGELWLPNVVHQEINGRSRKQSAQYLNLMLFDSFDVRHPGHERYEDRRDFLIEGNEVVKIVQPIKLGGKVYTEADLYEVARELKGRTSAYDGLMLKDPKGLYIPGHGKDGEVIKIKPRKTGDFRVVGTTKGMGNRKGGIGALVVDLGGGVTCEVGTGLTMADVFDREFIGKIVEVDYLGLTKDGRLREPSYQRTRDDKDVADVIEGNVHGDD